MTHTCPPSDVLTNLLDGLLANVERERVEDHVETCPACQVRLGGLVTDAPGRVCPRWRSSAFSKRLGISTTASTAAASFLGRLVRTGPKVHPAPPERPVVGGYEVFEELGRGGAGVVYRAHHHALDRPVALKVIAGSPYLAGELRQRFRIEAMAIARLHHPHIVQVYDAGEQDGFRFLSIELVEGQTLEDWQAGAARPPHQAAA